MLHSKNKSYRILASQTILIVYVKQATFDPSFQVDASASNHVEMQMITSVFSYKILQNTTE